MVRKAAFIDIGTNSIRYLAVAIDPSGSFTILERGLSAPRLGRGLGETGKLRNDAVEEALRELKSIKTRLETRAVEKFLCVGTEALRTAANSSAFIERADKLGLKVKVVSGREEARLICRGAAVSLAEIEAGVTLVDIGGGSTEIITKAGPGKKPRFFSLPLGCVRLKEQFYAPEYEPGQQDPCVLPRRPTPCFYRGRLRSAPFIPGRTADGKQVEVKLQRRMENHCLRILRKKWPGGAKISSKVRELIGLGGTFTTLAAIHLNLSLYEGEKVHGVTLQDNEIERIKRRLAGLPLEERKKVPGLPPSRADIILPGIAIAQAILEKTGMTEVTVSDRGLLFGMLEDVLNDARKLTAN